MLRELALYLALLLLLLQRQREEQRFKHTKINARLEPFVWIIRRVWHSDLNFPDQ